MNLKVSRVSPPAVSIRIRDASSHKVATGNELSREFGHAYFRDVSNSSLEGSLVLSRKISAMSKSRKSKVEVVDQCNPQNTLQTALSKINSA